MSKSVNYRSLPKLRDSISYVYVEHAVVEQDVIRPTHVGMNRYNAASLLT